MKNTLCPISFESQNTVAPEWGRLPALPPPPLMKALLAAAASVSTPQSSLHAVHTAVPPHPGVLSCLLHAFR